MERLENSIEVLQTRFARLLAEFIASQSTIKKRLHRLENTDLLLDDREEKRVTFTEDVDECF